MIPRVMFVYFIKRLASTAMKKENLELIKIFRATFNGGSNGKASSSFKLPNQYTRGCDFVKHRNNTSMKISYIASFIR